MPHQTRTWAAPLAVIAALAWTGPALAEGPALDFDRMNFSVKDIVSRAKAAAKADKTVVKPAHAASRRAERDCAILAFEPNGPSRSEAVWLRSTEWIEECHWRGNPRDGGHYDCWERPGPTYRRQVQAEIAGRQPTLPWERETFEACLEGPWLSFYKISPAYEYQVRETSEGYWVLTPGRKIPTDPDPAGITAGALSNAGGSLVLDFADRWASYYGAGEQTQLHVELWRDVPNWFDPKLAEGDLTFNPAASYRVDFAQFNPKLEPGKKYYVKWGFKRIGRVSKPKYVKRGKTDSTTYAVQAGAVAR